MLSLITLMTPTQSPGGNLEPWISPRKHPDIAPSEQPGKDTENKHVQCLGYTGCSIYNKDEKLSPNQKEDEFSCRFLEFYQHGKGDLTPGIRGSGGSKAKNTYDVENI